jgi:hypothetical protein
MANNGSPKLKPGMLGVWLGLLMMLLGLGSCIGGPVLAGIDVVSARSPCQLTSCTSSRPPPQAW